MEHMRRGRQPGIGLSIVLGVVQVVGCRLASRSGGTLDVTGYVLLLAGPVALVVRRRYPVAVFVVAAAAATTYGLTPDYPRGPFALAAAFALLLAVRAGQAGPTLVVALLGWAAYVFTGRVVDGPRVPSVTQSVLLLVGIVVLLMVSEASRVQGEHWAQQSRIRTEQRRREASEERLRIARELHDVIGHHLSLINVQAGVGLHLMDNQPEQARAALAAIKQASAEALREVRSVLGALRPDEEEAPRAPAPSLARVDELATGLPVDIRVEGEPRELPAEVDRAAYRIVQEALTNVRRHAGPSAAAIVTIGYGATALTVEVVDDGSGAATVPADDGAGLAGMRERAAALGGWFLAGPRPEGGFRVAASFPLEEMP